MVKPSILNCFVVGTLIILMGFTLFCFIMLLTLLPSLLWFVVGVPLVGIVVGFIALQIPFIRKEFLID